MLSYFWYKSVINKANDLRYYVLLTKLVILDTTLNTAIDSVADRAKKQ
jgi:hypothetical protein